MTRGRRRTILSVRTFLSNYLDESTPNVKVIKALIRRLYNRAHEIVVPSKAAALDLVHQFNVKPDKIKLIYNFVDQEKVSRLAMEPIDDPFLKELFAGPVLLNVGRLSPSKGQWLLLGLMKEVKAQFPDWKLVIFGKSEGEGDIQPQLMTLAEQMNLKIFDASTDQQPSLKYDVFLLPFQENPYRFMRQSRMLLFPSVYEGFPNTLLEAMQCGLPVITADCQSGPREILIPDADLTAQTRKAEFTTFGMLCPALPNADINKSVAPEITNEWLNATIRLIEDKELRTLFTQNGYKRVADFDKNTILQQWEASIGS